jgi:hypothetical protein
MILSQVDPASSNEPEIFYGDIYETKNTSIFAWSLIPGVEHYH